MAETNAKVKLMGTEYVVTQSQVTCVCSDKLHVAYFTRYSDVQEEVFLEFVIQKRPFWERLKRAISYIFKGSEIRVAELVTSKEYLQKAIDQL